MELGLVLCTWTRSVAEEMRLVWSTASIDQLTTLTLTMKTLGWSAYQVSNGSYTVNIKQFVATKTRLNFASIKLNVSQSSTDTHA